MLLYKPAKGILKLCDCAGTLGIFSFLQWLSFMVRTLTYMSSPPLCLRMRTKKGSSLGLYVLSYICVELTTIGPEQPIMLVFTHEFAILTLAALLPN